MFKDFVRNIPLSETNFDDNRNLTNLKQRFNTMVQIRHGTDLNNKYDPYIPSGVNFKNYKSLIMYTCFQFRDPAAVMSQEAAI